MKKLLPLLLLLIGYNVYANGPFKPQRTWNVIPDYVLFATPKTSSDVGISYGAAVYTSSHIANTNITVCTGFREDQYGKMEFRTWSDHAVGSGSGSLNVNSMSSQSLVSGDRITIVAGSYTGGGFNNLTDITIVPQTTRITFTGAMGFRFNTNVEWSFATWTGYTGGALDMRAYGPVPFIVNSSNGPDINCFLHNMAFLNLNSVIIDANGGLNHVFGDSTTYAWKNVHMDSITCIAANLLCQGSFGSPGDNSGSPPNVFRGTKITRLFWVQSSATGEEGTVIRGILLESDFEDWTMVTTTNRFPSGDVGAIYGHGNGIFLRMYRWGGPGYIVRLSPTREIGRPGSITIGWGLKANSSQYGMYCLQSPDSVTGKYGNIDSAWIFNNTAINLADTINYWCQLFVLGTRSNGGVWFPRYQVRNNVAIKIADKASGGAGHDGGTFTQRVIFNQGETWTTVSSDTSNNQYYSNYAQSGLDSSEVRVTTAFGSFPNYKVISTTQGAIKGAGTQNVPTNLSNVDLKGNALNSPADKGSFQFQIPIAPPANPNLLIKRKVQKLNYK